MNIVVLSYYYAWSASVGSRRMGGLVKGLAADGHTVTVIGATPPTGETPIPISGVTFISTPPRDRVLTARAALARLRRRMPGRGGTATPDGAGRASPPVGHATPPDRRSRTADGLRNELRGLVAFPDTMWEWRRTARRVVVEHSLHPDVIVASAPPMAGLHAAAALADHFDCPWVADMRDLWSGDPNRHVPRPLRRLDRRLERRVLSTASAITTVADALADGLRRSHADIPITVLRNGFDAAWLRHDDSAPDPNAPIVYTGTLTTNTGRSIDDLCDVAGALDAMRAGGRTVPTIEIYGAVDSSIPEQIADRGLGHIIHLRGIVGADQVRRAQHAARALLNLSWESENDATNLPAKLFEYAAARRPVLHLGRVETLGTRLVREHHLGYVEDPADADSVARLIVGLGTGTTPWTPPAVEDLTPLSQSLMVDGFRRVIRDATR